MVLFASASKRYGQGDKKMYRLYKVAAALAIAKIGNENMESLEPGATDRMAGV